MTTHVTETNVIPAIEDDTEEIQLVYRRLLRKNKKDNSQKTSEKDAPETDATKMKRPKKKEIREVDPKKGEKNEGAVVCGPYKGERHFYPSR